jgi:hypothetical protein
MSLPCTHRQHHHRLPPQHLKNLNRQGKRNLYAVCLRKVSYKSEQDAWEVAKRVYEQRNVVLGFYGCTFCKGIHLYDKDKARKKTA